MRLSSDDYLAAVREDAAALAAAAREGLDAAVPPCPGWVVRDVVGHTGAVHRQKEAIVRLGILDGDDVPDLEDPPGDDHLLGWFDEGVAMLLATLDVPPGTPAFSWYPPEQHAGFWQRRMAHETAIHRADAESAFGPISPIGTALAADGVDEILGMMAGYPDDPSWEFAADGRVVVIRMTDAAADRTLTLGTGKHGAGWRYSEGAAPAPDAVVSGTASDLDLWAWGRGPAGALTVDGEAPLLDVIRDVCREVT